jgi:hypothetical protein
MRAAFERYAAAVGLTLDELRVEYILARVGQDADPAVVADLGTADRVGLAQQSRRFRELLAFKLVELAVREQDLDVRHGAPIH